MKIPANETGPTVDDVAKLANVSTATVSRALRGLPNVARSTRQKVMQAAEELNYVIDTQAARLAMRRTMTIAVVMPLLDQWFYNKVAAHAEYVLRQYGYDTLRFSMVTLEERTNFFRQLASKKRVDGIIAVTVPLTSEDIDILSASPVPAVTIETDTEFLPSVSVDNELAIKEATQQLIELNHRRIAIISGFIDERLDFGVPIPEHRTAGYINALQEHNIDIVQAYQVSGDFSAEGGYRAMQELLQLSTKPTAVIAFSDEMALGALKAVKEQQLKVPKDISIIGFDDHDLSEYVGLSSVYQPVARFGQIAAQMLLDAIDGQAVSSVQLKTELRLRDTVDVAL